MITKNMKLIMAAMIVSHNGQQIVNIPGARKTDGTNVYIGSFFTSVSYPVSYSQQVITSITSSGIILGVGNTPATENDYTLENPITSGFTASTPSATKGVDNNGNPYLEYAFTVTNTGSSDLTIKEIGYIQSAYVGTTLNGSSSVGRLLLDRTVLETPVTIPSGEYAAIKYKFMLNMSA